MPRTLPLMLAAILVLAGAPALAADEQGGATEGGASSGGPSSGGEEFDLEDVFGFTEGTDVKSQGDASLQGGLDARLGKGAGRYGAYSAETKAGYGLTDRIELGFSLFGAGYGIGAVPAIADRSRFVFDGLEGEVKAAIVDRGEEGPVGLSVVGDLAWSRTDGTSGVFSDSLAGSLSLLADTHLVSETLFAAVNAGLDAERDVDAHETSSSLFVSLAASYRVGEGTTIGLDTRVESAFDDVLGAETGTAVFVGPSFYTDISDGISFQAGWLAQVDGSGARFNTENFERHRVTAALEFGF